MRKSDSALFPRRAGFTLMELLVVITIIAIVVSLTAAASMQVLVVQRRNNTEQTIKTLSSLLERQWRAVIDQARDENVPGSVLAMAGNDPRRARVIWIKLRLKQEFPMNFSEALYPWLLPPPLAQPMGQPNPYLGPSDLPAKPAYVQALRGAGIYVPAAGESPTANLTIPASTDATTWPAESSVCLLLALQQGRGGISFSQDKLPPGSLASAIGNLKQIVDAWQQPLVFYRWPALNPDVDNSNSNPAGAGAVFRDVQDPEGLLLDPTWNNGNTPNNSGNWFANWPNDTAQGYPQGVWWFELYCHPVHDSASAEVYNYARSYFMVPVIVSAGPNGRLGLAQQPWTLQGPNVTIPPSPLLPDLMSTDGTGDDNDNIYSYRLRLGARGD